MRLRATEQSSFNMKLTGRWFPQIVDRDSGNLYPIYIKQKIVVLASEPVGGRSRASDLALFLLRSHIFLLFSYFYIMNIPFFVMGQNIPVMTIVGERRELHSESFDEQWFQYTNV